jgi:hypothetical protein
MATTTVKSTYALDVATVRSLEEIAAAWGVSKSEALRRAISAARRTAAEAAPNALEALDALQRSLGMGRPAAARWAREVRAERRAAAARGAAR